MSQNHSLRVAVEGCGHGTLDAIYASVEKGCEVKGWDGVDLVIICGDFQAVRNHQDLNVTAMPAKYRKMGDFYQYYYGTKAAPYLTIFIGGNHEASNHLFELHYGGWAAPNIYYLGAANVVKLGPITIAGTSGVYKRYDYRKPHFERLPYNGSDIRSIYHQRELDIRKLLSYRSQVDVGLSHDWPRGIEWLGNHKALFARKKYLRAEAETGELGSLPSTLVLDRLRPPYWFAAHHHYRYAARKVHRNLEDAQTVDVTNDKTPVDAESSKQDFEADEDKSVLASKKVSHSRQAAPIPADSVSAWNTFKDSVKDHDAEAEAREEEAIRLRFEEQRRTGQHTSANYAFEESFREVSIVQDAGGQTRKTQSAKKQVPEQIPQLDGVCCSSLSKRRRFSSPSDETQPSSRARLRDQVNGSASEATVTNPDAIDIDMSDSDSDNNSSSMLLDNQNANRTRVVKGTSQENADVDVERIVTDQTGAIQRDHGSSRTSSSTLPRMPLIHEVRSQESVVDAEIASDAPDVGSNTTIVGDQSHDSLPVTSAPVPPSLQNKQHGVLSTTNEMAAQSVSPEDNTISRSRKYINDSSLDSTNGGVKLDEQHDFDEKSEAQEETDGDVLGDSGRPQSFANSEGGTDDVPDDVPDDIRAQLAQMSSTFAPEEKFVKSPDLPFPADITNNTTRFLALGKVEQGAENDFLQLIEIERNDASNVKEFESLAPQRPYELKYDPEWLAITRVFAPELKLGGSSRDKVPEHRGDTYYRDRIVEEEQWVRENIVSKDLLTIPKNFVMQTQQQDWDALSPKEKNAMPRELTNPQTSQFCELLCIPNPFDISEEERDARMQQGPATDNFQQRTNNRGRGGSRGNRGGGRGGWASRGGRGGGRGRGRGRGWN